MGNFEYDCPKCEKELYGSFGDNVYCSNCDTTYETDWDYTTEDCMAAWLTGIEHEGKIDVEEEEN